MPTGAPSIVGLQQQQQQLDNDPDDPDVPENQNSRAARELPHLYPGQGINPH
jgi:hypothetical protein